MMSDHKPKPEETPAKAEQNPPVKPLTERETGGQPGPEPTRYGDWEKGGIISDF